MKGREKNEYIWRRNRRGGLFTVTEFGDGKKAEVEGERTESEMGTNHERDGAARQEAIEND